MKVPPPPLLQEAKLLKPGGFSLARPFPPEMKISKYLQNPQNSPCQSSSWLYVSALK